MLSRIEEKLALTLFLLLCTFASSLEIHCILLFCLLIVRKAVPSLRPLSAESSRRFRKFFWYFLFLSTIMVLVNGALLREGPVAFNLGSLAFHFAGLLFGLETGVRILVLAVSLLIFFTSTTMKEIAGFLDRIGLPNQIVMTFLLTLHFVDQLPSQFERIFTAQEARGAPVRSTAIGRIRAFFAILTPLVLSSIVESIDRGMALELRGFHGKSHRTPVQQSSAPITLPTAVLLFLSLLSLLWIILQRLLP